MGVQLLCSFTAPTTIIVKVKMFNISISASNVYLPTPWGEYSTPAILQICTFFLWRRDSFTCRQHYMHHIGPQLCIPFDGSFNLDFCLTLKKPFPIRIPNQNAITVTTSKQSKYWRSVLWTGYLEKGKHTVKVSFVEFNSHKSHGMKRKWMEIHSLHVKRTVKYRWIWTHHRGPWL